MEASLDTQRSSAVAALGRGLLWGALFGAAFFAGDVVSALVRFGSRFDPKPMSVLLILAVGAFVIVPALLAGGLVGVLSRFVPPLASLARWRALGLLVVFTGALGYGLVTRKDPQLSSPRAAQLSVERPHHVLWILIDTLRADTLYGPGLDFPHAPNAARLAQDSILFTDAEASAGWTIPSTAALFTGVHPTALGADRGLLPNWSVTLAERLRAAGYRTRGFMDNALLDRTNGFAAGFETFFKRSPMDFAWKLWPQRLMPVELGDHLRHRLPISYTGAEELTDAALQTLAAEDGQDPLFFYVHYMDVHTPYRLHPDVAEIPEGVDELPLLDRALRRRMRVDQELVSDDHLETLWTLYETELTFLDGHLGRLIDAFYERCGKENSVVVLTSDHGEEFYEHGSFGHGMTLYKELVHVPLLLRAPGLEPQAGSRFDHPVRLVDVLPTTLDLLGFDTSSEPFPIQGISLLSYLRNGEAPPADPIYAAQNRFHRTVFRWRRGDDVYVVTKRSDGVEEVEVYNKADDYAEKRDLTSDQEELVLRMRAELDAFRASQVEMQDPGETGAVQNMDALRALGYIGE